ncbi:MAG: histidine phosphatase family protein [Pseudomonadota bacterium]
MKTLIIMRHAKSSWADPGAADFDRPLNRRGIASAKAIGEWLTFGQFEPDEVLCSSAQRTSQTWQNMGLDAEVTYMRALYGASKGTYLDTMRHAKGACVLMIGHNPGIAAFADMVVATPPAHPRFQDFPTASTLVATYNGDWSDLKKGAAEARAFTVPRDLMES